MDAIWVGRVGHHSPALITRELASLNSVQNDSRRAHWLVCSLESYVQLELVRCVATIMKRGWVEGSSMRAMFFAMVDDMVKGNPQMVYFTTPRHPYSNWAHSVKGGEMYSVCAWTWHTLK